MAFAENLKNLRTASGYSQAELAKLTGISQQTISWIERGMQTSPRWETVVKLANKLNVTPTELLGDSIQQATAEQTDTDTDGKEQTE